MSAMSYLQRHPKTGVYRFRRAVPPELRKVLNKTEIKKSLGTKDVREAKRLAMEMAAEVDRLFSSAKSGVSLSLADAEALAKAWKAEVLAEDAEKFASSAEPLDWADVERMTKAAAPFMESERQDLAARAANPYVVAQAKAVLAKQGVALGEDDPSFRRLCFAIHKALVDVQEITVERTRGVWRSEGHAPTPVVVVPTLSPLVQPAIRRRANDQGKPDATLMTVLERWQKAEQPRPKTLHEFETAVRRFNESVGAELPVRDITKQHVVQFLDDVAAMPRAMSNELRKRPLPEILKAVGGDPGVPRVSPGTRIKYHGALFTLLRQAKKVDLADFNAAEDLKPSDPSAGREKRLPFNTADLKLIFEQSPMYTGRRPVPDAPAARLAEFWLPLLALFTGARLDELGQLLVADVKREEGIDYLDLNTLDEGKALKTATSRRRVPLHTELLRCGFLDYVARLRDKGERQVFPTLHPDKLGSWTSALSKKLNRYLNDLGIVDRRKVVHSFRHTFKDACRRAKIEEEVHDALTGHSGGGVGRRYGGRPLDVLAEAMATIAYPVDLQGLQGERGRDAA